MSLSHCHQKLRIGTRASPMALAMANNVQHVIESTTSIPDIEILPFVAEGDRIQGSLQSYGGKGTFIKDLERRLLAGEIDCAIHSLKDIPGDILPHPDLALITFLTREDPRDAIVLRPGLSEDDIRQGGIIGSSAPRRGAALRNLYPAAEVRMCRGNVNSRLQKLDNGNFDAIILSYAGLKRLNLEDRASRVYSADEMLPAIGQGIVSIQVRKADIGKCSYLAQINDTKAETAAKVERAMLFHLQGNCHSAIAGYCSFLEEDEVNFCGMVYNPVTGHFMKSERQAKLSPDIDRLGTNVAEDLIAQGAKALMAA